MLVILDQGSLDIGDVNLDPITTQFTRWQSYDNTLPTQIQDRIKNAEVVISNKVVLDETIIGNNPQIKLICIAATGTNNVDLDAAKRANITVCNVTGYATPSVVQHVFSLILALQNNLMDYTSRVKNGEWDKADHFCLLKSPISELQGKTLGIIGYGELGKAVEKVAQAFGMKILISESLLPNSNSDISKQTRPLRTTFDTVIKEADIVTLHCPLSDYTNNLVNKNVLESMKPTSFLINTARGGIVNEADLALALDTHVIAGAALDVLSKEPPNQNILLKKRRDNLLVTPHIAWASQQARQRLIDEIAKNIIAFKKGERRNVVNL